MGEKQGNGMSKHRPQKASSRTISNGNKKKKLEGGGRVDGAGRGGKKDNWGNEKVKKGGKNIAEPFQTEHINALIVRLGKKKKRTTGKALGGGKKQTA